MEKTCLKRKEQQKIFWVLKWFFYKIGNILILICFIFFLFTNWKKFVVFNSKDFH